MVPLPADPPSCPVPPRPDLRFSRSPRLGVPPATGTFLYASLTCVSAARPRTYATVPTIRSDRRHGTDTFGPDFVGSVAPDGRRAPFCKPRSGCRRASVGLRLPTVAPFSQVFLAPAVPMMRTQTDTSAHQNVRSGTRLAGNVRLGPYLIEKPLSQAAARARTQHPATGHQTTADKGTRRTTV